MESYVKLDGLQVVLDGLVGLRERMENLSPAWQRLTPEVKKVVHDNFAAQGRPPWPRFKDAGAGYRVGGMLYSMATRIRVTQSGAKQSTFTAFVPPFGVMAEEGFKGTVTVREHKSSRSIIFGRRCMHYEAVIPEHKRKMDVPPRPYFGFPSMTTQPLVDRLMRWIMSKE